MEKTQKYYIRDQETWELYEVSEDAYKQYWQMRLHFNERLRQMCPRLGKVILMSTTGENSHPARDLFFAAAADHPEGAHPGTGVYRYFIPSYKNNLDEL